ncbi:MAG: TIGR02117 family protein [Chitinophagaceae bacterium]
MKLKKILKYLLYTVVTFVSFVLLYLLAAFCLSRITINKEPDTTNDVTIYIKTNGVHTDIVVPVKNDQMDWSKEILFSNTTAKDSSMQYLAMGWGDKGFYLETPTWADLKFRTAFRAAFALSTTAIHATFYRAMIENKSCKKIEISQDQYKRLVDYILNSLQKDMNGHAIWINTTANYGTTDAFYEATGSYSLFKTCNTWANKALKVSGQKCCLWTAFDTGIFLKYE